MRGLASDTPNMVSSTPAPRQELLLRGPGTLGDTARPPRRGAGRPGADIEEVVPMHGGSPGANPVRQTCHGAPAYPRRLKLRYTTAESDALVRCARFTAPR